MNVESISPSKSSKGKNSRIEEPHESRKKFNSKDETMELKNTLKHIVQQIEVLTHTMSILEVKI